MGTELEVCSPLTSQEGKGCQCSLKSIGGEGGGEQGLAAEGSKEARGRGANRNTLYLSYSGSQPQAFVKITKLYIESR